MRQLVCLLIAFSLNSASMSQSDDQAINNYAATQVTDCSLADGYVCADISEDNFLSNQSLEQLVPAIYFPAWQAAYMSFKDIEDLTIQQKELKHYRIGMTESEDAYIILFSALLLPEKIVDNTPEGVTNITFGQTTKFWIDKQTLEVQKYLFYR